MSNIWDQVINMGSSPAPDPIETDAMGDSPPTTPEKQQSGGSDSSKAHMFREAERANKVGKICVFVVNVVFNVCFWGIAINEYVRPAEQYITDTDAEDVMQTKEGYPNST